MIQSKTLNNQHKRIVISTNLVYIHSKTTETQNGRHNLVDYNCSNKSKWKTKKNPQKL